jgi:D-glycero-alpha-D-manno-heptose-7-phosphate kinase
VNRRPIQADIQCAQCLFAAGGVGGKLLGAGGFMVLLVDPEKRAQVRERLRKLIYVNVGFDTDGSKIVIYQPDDV